MTRRHTILAFLALSLPGTALCGSIEGKVTTATRRDGSLVVYVEKGPPSAAPVMDAASRIQIGQKQTRFTPSSGVVQIGANVDFPNFDKIYHNVFSLTPGNEFDLGLYRGGVSKTATFKEPGEVDIYCNIHPEMHARVVVVPDGRFVEVAEDGTYALTSLPAGEYTVVAWSPSHDPDRKQVKVSGDKAARADFSLEARRFPNTPHLNKTGEQYGRYK